MLCLGTTSITDSLKNSLADMFTGDGYSVNVSSGKLVLYKIIEPSKRLERHLRHHLKIFDVKFHQHQRKALFRQDEVYD